MSKAASSPTARLLQSSRLFSLPRPLPIQPELTTGVYRASETATTAYPTHQAIATPPSSHWRGDWGLKRAIPNKKTRSSTPTIRVRANDTYEHITDFTSAGDHVQTERKWAEMGVPFVSQSSKKSRYSEEASLSVFEDWLDNTDRNAKSEASRVVSSRAGKEQSPPQTQRWKYDGPWLAGMQDGEFAQYVQRTIGRTAKKAEWRAFLARKWKEKQLRDARSKAREMLEPLTEQQVVVLEEAEPAEEQLAAYEKVLRDEHHSHGLASDLTALICEFLDLPSIYTGTPSPSRFDPSIAHAYLNSPDSIAESGPPTTHPSAGLSHLRTDAMLHNHPIYGPQREKPPVEARVVRPRTRSGAVLEHLAKLGVGGVVADDSVSATSRSSDPRSARQEDRMAHSLDENVPGGNKMWVHPETAFMDSKSKIQLSVSRARPEAVAVKTGDLDRINEIYESKSGTLMSSRPRASAQNGASVSARQGVLNGGARFGANNSL